VTIGFKDTKLWLQICSKSERLIARDGFYADIKSINDTGAEPRSNVAVLKSRLLRAI